MDQSMASFNPDQVDANLPGEIAKSEAGQEQPQYVTRADLDALAQEIKRDMQSMTGKQENRLKKEFERQLNERQQAYASLGMTMPDNERTVIAQRVMDSMAPDGKQPGQVAPSRVELDVATVNRLAENIFTKAGVTQGDLTEDDLNTIRRSGDPDDYLEDVRRIAAAVAERKKGQPQRPASPATAPAIGGGQPAGGDLAAQYRQEVIAAKGKGTSAFNDIRKRYRERGLDVESVKVF